MSEATVAGYWDMRCPKCKADDALKVKMTIWGTLTPGGTDPGGESEWDSESACMCQHCHWYGTAGDCSILRSDFATNGKGDVSR